MAWRIARSTREAVVPCILATVGYSSFVTLLIISGSSTDSLMAERRY